MCLTCGCGKPNDKHGDNRNITQNDLDMAAQAAGISSDQAMQNMVNTYRQSDSSGQSQQGSTNQSSNQQGSSALWGESNTAQVQDQPGQAVSSPGQESGTAWQESQQMGRTGTGGAQNPAQG